MKTNLSAAFVGLVFSLGLGLAGMTQPLKIIGFLDVFGNWNPALLFVMVGAISVHAIAYRMIIKRSRPLLSPEWHIPKNDKVTPSLILGSMIFGIGWGLAGYCPGPAITSLASLQSRPVIFVVCMLLGMFCFKILDQKFNIKR
jgi:uncharacterized membrane protein YedE/YeeE